MECKHKNVSHKTVEKEIFDLKFKHKTLVCKDCGAFLRGNEFEKAYMNWLEGVYKDRRDKFQVQCYFSNNLMKCAESFLDDYPGISVSVFMRILVTVYMNFIDRNEKLSPEFEGLLDAKIYDSFHDEKEHKKVNIQFKPNMMIELVAVSELIEEKTSVIAEEAIIKMMTAITSQDQKLRSFWEKEIKEYLDLFLKAA